MRDFRTLSVWEKAHRFTLSIYGMTGTFPKEEMFGLTSQLRRSCASIPANIAEGCGRSTDTDFARFLQIAFGSACEVEYLLFLANDLNYISLSDHEKRNGDLIEIKKMLSALISKLRANS